MKKVLAKLIFFIGCLFYDKKYLYGKHFTQKYSGFYWIVKGIWFQKFLGFNRKIPWPINSNIVISDYKNLIFHSDDLNNFQTFGCYFQNISSKIYLCKGVFIAPNVGIITSNHDYKNLNKHLIGKNVVIGSNSWIGMNSVILPGVKLGSNTIVGAGSIVTKSFRQGNIVIAGNPAKIIKEI